MITSKHVKKTKLQFTLFSLVAVSGILAGSFEMKNLGLHRVFSVRQAEATMPPGLQLSEVAPDVTYDGPAAGPEEEGHAMTVPVLLYHGLVDKRDRFSMTPETFRDQLFALKREGYTTLTVDQYLGFLKGEKVPAKSMLITFDDGRTDSYAQADPVLKATGFTAVMYVAGDMSLGLDPEKHNKYYLTIGDLKAMTSSGRWEIGSHALQVGGGQVVIDGKGTLGNFLSNRAWMPAENRIETLAEYEQRIRRELVDNRNRLENRIGTKVRTLSYPYGDFGQQQLNNPEAQRIIAEIADKTYDVAFRQVWDNDPVSKTNDRDDDRLLQKRIEVNTGWTGEQLTQAMAKVIDKQLPFADDMTSDRGWRRTWGESTIADGDLVIRAKENSSGGDAYLDGSHWTDVAFLARYDWVKGDRFTLVGRYRNDGTYVQCVFGGDQVRLDRVDGGKVTTIAQERSPVFIPSMNGTVGMRLVGGHAECAVGSMVAVFGQVPIEAGKIGFKVWDPKNGTAELRVHDVRATVP